jgi:hypothetical protein
MDEENAHMDGRSVILEVMASAPLIVDIDRGEVRSAVSGLTADEASQALQESFSLDAPPSIEIQPDWIKRWQWLDRVPVLRFRVQVVVLE